MIINKLKLYIVCITILICTIYRKICKKITNLHKVNRKVFDYYCQIFWLLLIVNINGENVEKNYIDLFF